jgi:nicotinate-nucleotide adenylyltransferase
MEPTRQRLGLMGGAFNPIHLGHLRAAEAIREQHSLDVVVFIPTALPPHKDARPMAPLPDRLAMTRLATENNPGFEVSDIEGRLPAPSYTVTTMEYFRDQCGDDTTLFFLTGMDSFLDIGTWKDYQRLFSLVEFIVFTRPGADASLMSHVVQGKVSPEYQWDEAAGAFIADGLKRIHVSRIFELDISSTEIRRLVAQGRSVRYLIPDPVREYISIKGLYRRNG